MNQHRDSIHTLRIELEPPERGESQADVAEQRRWIEEGYEEGYELIATYHHYPHNGQSDPQYLQNAADWWVEQYDALSSNAEFTINLMNEWGGHDVGASEWASAYTDAIATVRKGTDYTKPIVVDAPGYGQNVHAAAEGVHEIDDDNIIISTHVYGVAYNAGAGESLRSEHLDHLDDQGYPCLIGEFGTRRPGSTDATAVIQHANELDWPVIAWAWNGDGETPPMNMASPAWSESCSGPYSASDYFDEIIGFLHGRSENTPDTPEDPDEPDEPDGPTTPAKPIAEIDPSTTEISVGERISFNARDTSGKSRWPTCLSWNLGDDTTKNGWWIDHRYRSSGSYTVSLTATDNDGESTTDEVTITVID
ncbi:cellulase family glycosylhydrolase [Natrinema halophilum]|uniref:Cellulase family glycosylhydrolase n=1 Tax=Natrinema halophilum TaxID=1699371 RepID=A0A7D5KYZ4_9EURY|nr:cellulase family glycosylhydrolase [Natrinema halophilum]QLG48100.1 cellulase family glycosylhydrolase [Natrinema halophilum]